MQILVHWMNAMYHCTAARTNKLSRTDFFTWNKKNKKENDLNCVGGWIPREMILGNDAEKR